MTTIYNIYIYMWTHIYIYLAKININGKGNWGKLLVVLVLQVKRKLRRSLKFTVAKMTKKTLSPSFT